MYNMFDLRRALVADAPIIEAPTTSVSVVGEVPMTKRRVDDSTGKLRRRKKKSASASRNGETREHGHSDAA
jgi:hypothetical protein